LGYLLSGLIICMRIVVRREQRDVVEAHARCVRVGTV
jgi:hypothetical protein